jgi:ATP-binding cassette, subfamily B, multidrug efflux pump
MASMAGRMGGGDASAGRRGDGFRGLMRTFQYLGLQKWAVFLAYGSLFVATISQLFIPKLIQNMINAITDGFAASQVLALDPIPRQLALLATGQSVEAVQTQYASAEQILINGALIIVLLALGRGVFSFVQTYMAEWTSQGIAFHLRNDLFAKLQSLSFSYYDRNQTGQLMIRATDDVEKVRLFMSQGLLLALQSFLLLTITLVVLFATNWQLTLVILPTLPIALALFIVFGRIAQPLFAEVQRRLSALNTILQENIAGIKVVKAFVRQPYESGRFDEATDRLYQQQLQVAKAFSFLFPFIILISLVGQVAILYFGGSQIVNGTLTLGEYQEFSLYLAFVFLPLGQLGFIISLMSQAAASASRTYEILDADSEVKNLPDARPAGSLRGDVTFDNVSFRYFNSTDWVLQDVAFEVTAGQTVALLGATGSGKTSIINLVPRFYDTTSGSVKVDGHDVRSYTLDSLRSQIGIVLQETNLFSGTIRDNIAFGRPNARDDEVIEAAKGAAAHEFIMSFPEGYETPVGERGTTLSGGQKQRIAIARALLLKPSILIMDDSTSSVDYSTENVIQAALARLMAGRTSFIIAQRISTVRNADLIIVLEQGHVVATGTHADLMSTSTQYVDIYNSQLIGEEPVASPQEARHVH